MNAADWTSFGHNEYTNLQQEYGHESLFFHRVDLHQGLIELATRSEYEDCKPGPPVLIKTATEVETIDCDAGVLTLASGESVTKDLLVVADGAHVSPISKSMFYKLTDFRATSSLNSLASLIQLNELAALFTASY